MRALQGLLASALLLAAPAAVASATIVITNGDAPGVGFNDPTVVSPVGGNTGTTLGAQRLIIFQTAASIWGQALDSPAPISVIAHFQPLACDTNGAVLGSAGPTNFFSSDDPSLDGGVPASAFPHPQTWYVSALTSRFAGKAILSGTGTDPNNFDILARFNSALDTAACGSQTWYYGLDDQHGNAIDLLTVVLHEFGHGLGFLSLVSLDTGAFPAMNEPDIWSYFLYDESSGKHWKDMTASQRAASAVSGALAWDGPSVITAVPNTLGFPVVLRVTSAPQTPSVVKDYQFSTAEFGAVPGASAVSGELAVGSTGFGCSAQGRLDPLTGKFALLDRGGPDGGTACSFVEKARNAQDAGAIALIVANNVASPPLAGMAGTAPDVTIPVVGVTQADGVALKGAVGAGTVNVSLLRDTGHARAGADASNRALMYAPTTLEQGSSVSHWDKSAFPNLLMEPVISADLTHSLDMTVPLLHDIGWTATADAGTPNPPAPKDSGGCNAGIGPPAPWLALLALGAFVRRRRRA